MMFRSASIQAAVAALALGAAAVNAARPAAQAPAQPPPAAPDFSKVEIKTTKVGNNFYVLEGQGVFLLDGAELPMHAGDMLVAPDGVPHGVGNTGEARLAVLVVLAPGDHAAVAVRTALAV